MKKKLLFTLYSLDIGGDVSSLLSLLHTIDYDQYEVDLALLRREGDMLPYLPKEVNLLPQVFKPLCRGKLGRINRILTYLFRGFLLENYVYVRRYGSTFPKGTHQVMSYAQNSVTSKQKTVYDVAIGYVELWPLVYTVTKVKAKRKVGWLHADYIHAGFDPKLDKAILEQLDSIVCVSKRNLDNFVTGFKDLGSKAVFIENITSVDYIQLKGNEPIEDMACKEDGLNLVTVARIDFADKGVDRIVLSAHELKNRGYKFKWFIIGDGPERSSLIQMISDHDLVDEVIVLGKKINPFPYLKKSDAFVMTSRFEGKPIAVTEALIMGLPVITTAYQSATEQLSHMVDGIIVDNGDTTIVDGLELIFQDPSLLEKLQENVRQKDYGNVSVVKDYYNIFERGNE